MNQHLNHEAYVTALYQALLGRDPDSAGLAGYVALLSDTQDHTLPLALIMNSPEYRERTARVSSNRLEALAKAAHVGLGRRPRIVDVGAQLLGTNPYDPLRPFMDLDVVGFDPLEDRMAERASAEISDGLILLPYAVGDGGMHTLHVNDPDATSSLFPLFHSHNAPFRDLRELRTVYTQQVQTRRLDDVLEPGPVDFLKLDVQGAELMVLQGAENVLASTAIVHTEVEFAPIYEGQPLYPDIHNFLSERGFSLIDLINPHRYHYAAELGANCSDRLLWADAVFFRETSDNQTLLAQALCAAAIYNKSSLATFLLERAGIAVAK